MWLALPYQQLLSSTLESISSAENNTACLKKCMAREELIYVSLSLISSTRRFDFGSISSTENDNAPRVKSVWQKCIMWVAIPSQQLVSFTLFLWLKIVPLRLVFLCFSLMTFDLSLLLAFHHRHPSAGNHMLRQNDVEIESEMISINETL